MSIKKELDGRVHIRTTPGADMEPFHKVVSTTTYWSEGRTVVLTFVGKDSQVEIMLAGETANELTDLLR